MTSPNIFRYATHSETFPAGTTILIEGQPGAMMYIVTEGSVDIFMQGDHIATVGVGGVVGEMALVSGRPRNATVIARTDCTLMPIDERQLTFLIQQTPAFATQLMKLLVDRLHHTETGRPGNTETGVNG